MVPYRSLSFIILSILACTSQAFAGWIIDQAVKSGDDQDKHQVMLQANQMKTIMLNNDGKPESALIMDLNAETFTQVNYRDQSYMTIKVQEYAEAMQSAMKKATSAMEEAMKDMPPERRKMMEQMMRKRMPQAAQDPEACREPKMETRKTGQKATIAGFQADSYEVLADGKAESEVWIAKGITAGKELDPKKMERLMSEFSKAIPRCGPGKGRHLAMSRDQAWKLFSEGYPVRTVDRSGSNTTVEVVKAESRSIPALEFQPPANFARKTFKDMMGKEH